MIPPLKENFTIAALHGDKSRECEKILRALPEWFGIESSLQNYCAEVANLPVLAARTDDNRVIGLISIMELNPHSSEIHVMGVLPEYHRSGIGTALLTAACEYLKDKGARMLLVKTVGPSFPNQGGYEQTRKFYERSGFTPLEELAGIWPGIPCLLMVRAL